MWNLNEGVEVCRKLEPICKQYGYHVALGGSVLYRGTSLKDLDIFIYPHNTVDGPEISNSELLKKFSEVGIGKSEKINFATSENVEPNGGEYPDRKDVYKSELESKRIDFFFVK